MPITRSLPTGGWSSIRGASADTTRSTRSPSTTPRGRPSSRSAPSTTTPRSYLQTGVIQQYTDVLGGNMAPAPLKGGKQGDRLAFISYFKNEYKLQTKDTAEPLKEIEQEVQAAA